MTVEGTDKLVIRGGRNRIGRREKWPKKSWEEGEIGGKSREEGESGSESTENGDLLPCYSPLLSMASPIVNQYFKLQHTPLSSLQKNPSEGFESFKIPWQGILNHSNPFSTPHPLRVGVAKVWHEVFRGTWLIFVCFSCLFLAVCNG